VSDLVTTSSRYSVAETVQRLVDALARRSITLFARIDHAAGAHSVGLELPGETVLVFGNPELGTPLMQQDARVGLDLPLRLLVWEDAGATVIGFHDPHTLGAQYELAADATLARMGTILAELVREAST
jgi:uncharacterized protein (DUF302 family)